MDLFALGILAWEVMTGKRFYGGEGELGGVGGRHRAVAGATLPPIHLEVWQGAVLSGNCGGWGDVHPTRLFSPACPLACLPGADASDAEVMLMLMGHKLLPSEGDKSVLGQVRDQFSLPAVSVGQATLLQAERRASIGLPWEALPPLCWWCLTRLPRRYACAAGQGSECAAAAAASHPAQPRGTVSPCFARLGYAAALLLSGDAAPAWQVLERWANEG
jgi:hypothetical protein